MLSQSRSRNKQSSGLWSAVVDIAHISFTMAISAPNSDWTIELLACIGWVNKEAGNNSMSLQPQCLCACCTHHLEAPTISSFSFFSSNPHQQFLKNLSPNLIMSICYSITWILIYLPKSTLGNIVNWTLPKANITAADSTQHNARQTWKFLVTSPLTTWHNWVVYSSIPIEELRAQASQGTDCLVMGSKLPTKKPDSRDSYSNPRMAEATHSSEFTTH